MFNVIQKQVIKLMQIQGRIQGGAQPPPPPPRDFSYEIPQNFHWKKSDFRRKIVIFHTKYRKNFRASLRSAQFF